MQVNLSILKLGLIFFWASWLTLTFVTNVFDGMKVRKVLPEGWKFASDNIVWYALICLSLPVRG